MKSLPSEASISVRDFNPASKASISALVVFSGSTDTNPGRIHLAALREEINVVADFWIT